MTITLTQRARGAASLLAALLLAACASAPPGPSESPANPAAAAATPSPTTPTTDAAPSPAASASAASAEAPVDPLRPEVPVDLNDASVQIDLWQRVRNGFGIPDLDDEFVRRREQYYASRPDYVQRMTERGGRYLFHIVEEVQRRGLPTELALLPFIESAFNPQAVSSARASGMWQFMPGTGRDFDLKQNVFRDDRRDVLASTRAALDYLTRLHGQFGDWHLALAAYNWGEGNLQRAIKRNQRNGLPTDYSSLRMPAETRDYVPKLQAVKNIIANPQAFSLALPALHNHPYFVEVPISRDIDVALACRLAGLSMDEFQALNPQMNQPVILSAGSARVLLPYDNAATFTTALEQHQGPMASWTAWVAPRTMKPALAARQVGMTERELCTVNRIPPRMLIKAGSTLLVPRSTQRQTDVSEQLADHAMIALSPDAPPLRRVAFRAGKKGTSVAAVARRYRVSASQVAQWNKVGATARFAAGKVVVVYVPRHGAKVKSVRTASADKARARTAARGKTRAASAKRAGRTAQATASTKAARF
jgi:membrane-bound lytic murein transglycosylase D